MKEKKEIPVQIGARIRKVREDRGLTQEKLAELIPVTPQYLSDLERGVVGISISNLLRFCDVLSVSSDSLLMESSGHEPAFSLPESIEDLSPRHQEILCSVIRIFIESVTQPHDDFDDES